MVPDDGSFVLASANDALGEILSPLDDHVESLTICVFSDHQPSSCSFAQTEANAIYFSRLKTKFRSSEYSRHLQNTQSVWELNIYTLGRPSNRFGFTRESSIQLATCHNYLIRHEDAGYRPQFLYNPSSV